MRIRRNKVGIVKFIGIPLFTRDEVIGVELNDWSPTAHNGTVRGTKYFEAKKGHGYFTRRNKIINTVRKPGGALFFGCSFDKEPHLPTGCVFCMRMCVFLWNFKLRKIAIQSYVTQKNINMQRLS